MDTIENRLAILERSVRRWKTATLALLLIVPAGALIAADKTVTTEFDVIRAHRIEVVDPEGGKTKVEIHATDGMAEVEATGADGKNRFIIAANPSDVVLGLCRNADSVPILMQVKKDGASLTLSDEVAPPGPQAIRNQHLTLVAVKSGCGIQYTTDNQFGGGFNFSRKRSAMTIGTPSGKAEVKITADDATSHIRLLDEKGVAISDIGSAPASTQPAAGKQ